MPFELVDDVLEQTKTVQRRLRSLPSRAGVYFVLALGLFPQLGYARVWGKLTAGLAGLPGLEVACPSEKALRDLRRRLGPAPLKALFEVLAGPLAWPYAPGVSFCGLRTVAFDGCSSLRVPDTARNRAWLGRIRHPHGYAGYPALRLLTLAETGTRGLLGAVIGAAADGDDRPWPAACCPCSQPGMLVLTDRAYDQGRFLAEVAGTGAHFLARAKASRSPLVLDSLCRRVLPAPRSPGCDVRVIDAHITVTGARWQPLPADRYRLITTLLDHHRFPARPPGAALSRAVGDRIRLLRPAPHHAARPRAALRRPARPRTGNLGPAGPLPAAAQGHDRRDRHPPRHRPRPGQLHHRPASRPRPAHHRHRPHPHHPRPARHHPTPSWPACCHPAGPATAPAQVKNPRSRYPGHPRRPPPQPTPATITAIDHHHHHPTPRQKHPAQPPQTPPPPPRHPPPASIMALMANPPQPPLAPAATSPPQLHAPHPATC